MEVIIPNTKRDLSVGDIIMVSKIPYLIFEPKYQEYNLVSLKGGTIYFRENQRNLDSLLNQVINNSKGVLKIQVFSSEDFKLVLKMKGDI